jgi:hypothetical protein
VCVCSLSFPAGNAHVPYHTPLDFCLHRHPVSWNCLCHARMVLFVGGFFALLCTKCTLHSNHTQLLVWYSNTRNDFSPGAAIFSLHTPASPSGRNVNYDEKQLLVWYSNTQNDLSPGAAIFSLHTPASPSGRNVNYDEKQLTGGEGGNWVFPSICTDFVNTCPMVSL